MKRTVTLEIDPKDYFTAHDSPKGCVNLVIACLKN